MLNIQPIKLLKGSYEDTGKTGQGCFMNVVAYLNGEPQITDKSECVCPTIRPIAIWINDFLSDRERQILLPFVLRAVGTKTDDRNVINERLRSVVLFANNMSNIASIIADFAAAYAVKAASAAYDAARAAEADAVAEAVDAASAAAYADAVAEAVDGARKKMIDAAISFLDAVCPPIESCSPSPEVINRANELVSLNVEGATCEKN